MRWDENRLVEKEKMKPLFMITFKYSPSQNVHRLIMLTVKHYKPKVHREPQKTPHYIPFYREKECRKNVDWVTL